MCWTLPGASKKPGRQSNFTKAQRVRNWKLLNYNIYYAGAVERAFLINPLLFITGKA
jgi:hypothetical protein